jgi:hypothetical protein
MIYTWVFPCLKLESNCCLLIHIISSFYWLTKKVNLMSITFDSIFRHDLRVDVSHSNAVSIVTSQLPVSSLVAMETSHKLWMMMFHFIINIYVCFILKMLSLLIQTFSILTSCVYNLYIYIYISETNFGLKKVTLK